MSTGEECDWAEMAVMIISVDDAVRLMSPFHRRLAQPSTMTYIQRGFLCRISALRPTRLTSLGERPPFFSCGVPLVRSSSNVTLPGAARSSERHRRVSGDN